MRVESYLKFNGRCDEALAFYKKAVGAKVVMLMRFKDNPDGKMPPNIPGEQVMHCKFRIGDTDILATDCGCTDPLQFEGFQLSISADSGADAERIFNALCEGGRVKMPITKTFFASSFGMLQDRFGISWIVLAGNN